MQVVNKTNLPEYELLTRGKVRDIYKIDQEHLLIVSTDRMSAFDVVLPDPIPYKGIVLNELTIYWMHYFQNLVSNHLQAIDLDDFPQNLRKYSAQLEGRSVIVKKTNPLPIECIVRGYLSGSGWKDYLQTGQICGYSIPPGLQESEKLPEPLFTPSTKAELGDHDQNISLEQAQDLLDSETLSQVQDISLSLYQKGDQLAEQNGIIIADTKFEFGVYKEQLLLIDEVLTPDSSRFWPRESYRPGQSQPSFDKQFLRDWLNQNWDRKLPAPNLPQEIIDQTQEKYFQAYRLLTGQYLPGLKKTDHC